MPETAQARWAATLEGSGLTYVNEQLKEADYLAREFPPSVELNDTITLEVWTNDQPRTMQQIREAITKAGLTPASPQHAPAYAPEQADQSTIWIPQYSESRGASGYHQLAHLYRHGGRRDFDQDWDHPDDRWYEGHQFLVVRTERSDA